MQCVLLEYCHALLMLRKGDRVNLKFNFNLSTRVRFSLAIIGRDFSNELETNGLINIICIAACTTAEQQNSRKTFL